MSTIRVNAIQNTTTTDGGISIDSSGHVTVDGQALPSAGPLSNRNLIINGAMQVAQRGTSQASVSDGSNEGYQTLDRFGLYFSNSAGGTCTVSQDTDVPSNEGFSNSYKVDVTSADTSLATNHTIYVSQQIEAQNVRNSGWNYTSSSDYITLSFWVKSSKAGTYSCLLRAMDVTTTYYAFEYTLTAGTWKKVTHSIPGDSTLVFNNDTGAGLNVRWNLAAGTDRNDATADQWNTGSSNNQATSNQVNFFDSTDNDFYLTGVQLEVGQVATPFEHRSYGDELAKCQRYYVKDLAGTGHNGQTSASTSWFTLNVGFPVEMRTNPTIVATSPNNGTVNRIELWGGTDLAYSSFSRTKNNIYWVNTSSSYTTAKAVQAKFTADAEL